MPLNELMLDGVNLMLLGMGTVFVFLGVLVAAMYAMSALAARLSVEPRVTPPQTVAPAPPKSGDEEVVAVISAAISRYRSRHR